MSSIMTNASAMTALKTLQATNKALETTQSRIATGFRVGEASDNAAYWSIATTMRSDNKALSTVQDALGLGAAKVDVAYTGINSAIDVVDEIKSKLVAAREPGVDRTKIQSEIAALQGQLTSNAAAATFSGENWLSVDSAAAGYSATKTIVSSFTRASDGTVSVGTISVDTASTKLFDSAADAAAAGTGILDGRYDAATGALLADQSAGGFTVATLDISALTNSAADLTTLENYISGVDHAIGRMTTAASDLGAAKKRIDLQSEFVGNLMDTIDKGVGTLVDADMNKESTRLQALQVQQQLGIQALSMANSNSQTILSLFR
ncbi:flagellin [Nitratireductor mangrovi]|uniref:Flagellin n=1 Tax=Nitratireductor mangrovi TaxID=2599600 RepID=A0A5B8L4G3_9HYPH|nr:flagellin [Nitratireductor mangrovi]QDZ02709.1 flagellin [Nitratireductor mangrovi]